MTVRLTTRTSAAGLFDATLRLPRCGRVAFSVVATLLLSGSVASPSDACQIAPAGPPPTPSENSVAVSVSRQFPVETQVQVPDNSQGPRPLAPLAEPLAGLVKNATPLNPAATVFVDVPGKRVILRTEVACRNCILEMLCVPEGIKEHETILRLRSRAYVVHAGLLALGLEPGKSAQFSPDFVAPQGTMISIYASWVDADGRLQRQDVRRWIRHNIHRYYSAPLPVPPPGLQLPYLDLRYDPFNKELLWYGPMSDEQRDDLLGKWKNPDYQKAVLGFHKEGQSRPMTADFVFVGSRFYQDPDTGEQSYQAEGGYLICLANFPDAMIDIREASSANDGSQAYEAWTEQLPPEGTPVLLELVPVPAPPNPSGKPEPAATREKKPH